MSSGGGFGSFPCIWEKPVQPLEQADISIFRTVRFVLTDMDETLTFRGQLAAETYAALARLQLGGVKVIPVTAAPAGWCDQMARMWPVDGVIGENGGFFFRRTEAGHGVERHFWHNEEEERAAAFQKLKQIRLTSLAFGQPEEDSEQEAILSALRAEGADATINNLWILGWLGGYDKLAMARRVLLAHYGLDVEKNRDALLYTGDSTNDAPMFSFFRHTVGVSTVANYLDWIPQPPRFITRGPGGAGFVEAANAVLKAREG